VAIDWWIVVFVERVQQRSSRGLRHVTRFLFAVCHRSITDHHVATGLLLRDYGMGSDILRQKNTNRALVLVYFSFSLNS